MKDTPLFITTDDYARLRLLLPRSAGPRTAALDQLRNELDRAVILDPKAIPPGVVTMGSQVEIEDIGAGDVETYTLVFPENADIDQRRLSVLAPIGTAIIGYAEGAEVSWMTPGGARHFRIRRVVPAEAEPTPTPTY